MVGIGHLPFFFAFHQPFQNLFIADLVLANTQWSVFWKASEPDPFRIIGDVYKRPTNGSGLPSEQSSYRLVESAKQYVPAPVLRN